jgi:hypothetical protein
MRAALAQLFWSCESSELRSALLVTLGEPPDSSALPDVLPVLNWAASPNGLPLPGVATDAPGAPAAPQWRTG